MTEAVGDEIDRIERAIEAASSQDEQTAICVISRQQGPTHSKANIAIQRNGYFVRKPHEQKIVASPKRFYGALGATFPRMHDHHGNRPVMSRIA